VGGESQGNPTREGECHLFLAEKLRGAFGQPAFILANRMIIVACESGFFAYLAKRLFNNVEGLNLRKKLCIIYKLKEKRFKIILSCLFAGRRKVQVT